jgi:hypothetical protein
MTVLITSNRATHPLLEVVLYHYFWKALSGADCLKLLTEALFRRVMLTLIFLTLYGAV